MSQSRGGVSLTRVRAVSRAVAILKVFSGEEPWLPLRRIAEHTSLDPGTVRRILVTLCDEGLVRQDPDTSRYALSSGVIAIANAAPRDNRLSDLAATAMQELAGKTSSTVFLSVIRHGQLLCLSRVSALGAVEVRFPVVDTSNDPDADYTGAAKVLMAFGSDGESAVTKKLRPISEQGWHLLEDAPVAGLTAIAAPVLLEGQCIAALSVAGLSPALIAPGGGVAQQLPLLQGCCKAIEKALQLSPNIEIA